MLEIFLHAIQMQAVLLLYAGCTDIILLTLILLFVNCH